MLMLAMDSVPRICRPSILMVSVSFYSCPEGFHSSLQPLHAEHILTLPHLFPLRIGSNHRAPAPGHQRVAFSFFVFSMQVHGSPFTSSVLKHNKYIYILPIAVTTLLYIMISMITIFSMYIVHVHLGSGCNSHQGHVNDSGEFWRAVHVSGVTENTILWTPLLITFVQMDMGGP